MSAAFAARDAIVELRQYTLHPGRRDELIALFEREFVGPQDAAGARVIGRFRDVDDADRFVWLRGFDSMTARHAALTAFYDSEVWRRHRDAAAATMRDSDNVLLLRPVERFVEAAASRPVSACLGLIYDLRGLESTRLIARFATHFATVGAAVLRDRGAVSGTILVTESSPNSFTRLPVRTDESVLVCMADFADLAALDACVEGWLGRNAVRLAAPDALLPAFMRRPEILRLVPTAGPAAR